MRIVRSLLLLVLAPLALGAQGSTLLSPARVFDGTAIHEGWVVLVQGDSIVAAGPASSVHALTGKLRAVADAIETRTPPRVSGPLPADPELEVVTSAVHSVLSVLIKSGSDGSRAAEGGAPAAAAPA